MHSKIKKIVIAALMTALVCVATMIVKIPSPMKGYLNLGDCIVLAAGWILPPGYGFLAAGLGSALADLFSGYAVYVPATFLIKGAMALIAFACFKLLNQRLGKLVAQIIGGVLAEIAMVAGYFVFEGFLYGFGPSLVNVPANAAQGLAGIVIGTVLIKVFERLHLPNDVKKD
ncbi:MAG: ECF transporter S component [Clostridia bacterium]|nr:ECF transporter S component [Clostridia bacterium]